jgi:acetamidase/formamidase
MKALFSLALAGGLLYVSVSARAATHELKLTPANVHWGYYDARLKPVLKIASGDTVRIETMVAGGLERLKMAGAPDAEIPDSLKQVENTVTDRGPGAHPLTGPIFVEGAEPGDTIELRILGFEFLHPFGVTAFRPGAGTLPDDFPYARLKLIRVDPKAGTAQFSPGVTLKLAPFWGSIGVAPPLVIRRLSSGPPGAHAGNLDNKELVAGSTLYLPVHVPGALISVGDGHALQADGESDDNGIGDLAQGHGSDICPQGQADPLAAGGDPDPFHRHGTQSGLERGSSHGNARDDRFFGFREGDLAR